MADLLTMAVPGATLKLDPFQGTVCDLRFACDDGWLTPLDDSAADLLPDPAPARQPVTEWPGGGPFLCSGDPAPRGWRADSPWIVEELVQTRDAVAGRFTLGRRPKGARVERELCLQGNVPLLYQSHWLSGGRGRLPVTHPAMLRLSEGDLLSLSPKCSATVNSGPDGRERDFDLTKFVADGGALDLNPFSLFGEAVSCIRFAEMSGRTLGWTAVLRARQRDIVFLLKDCASLPVTTLWVSDEAPDDARAWGRGLLVGLADARGRARKGRGRTAGHLELAPDRCHMIRHVIGAIPRPDGWRAVRDIRLEGASLLIHGDSGTPVVLPFEPGFFDA